MPAQTVVAEARSQPIQSDAAQHLVGIWRYVGTWIDGKPRPNRGANPKGYIPGTAMGFAGIPKDSERADVIAYLNSLSEHPQPLPTASK